MVSAAHKAGHVEDVEILSEKGEDCVIHGEWRVLDSAGKAVNTDRDEFGRLRFKTVPGGKYALYAK